MTNSNYTAVDFDPFAEGEILLTAPATESQKEVWASVQMGDEANLSYNESSSIKLTGNLDLELLKKSIQALIQRHESLRITFSKDGTNLCIAPSLTIEIPVIDLSNLSDQERENQIAKLKKQVVEEPFNLEQGPLFRAQIIQGQNQVYFVFLTAHHIVCDGWSWWILIGDLGNIYSAFKQGIDPQLEKAESFSEYASLEQEKSHNLEGNATEEFWLKQFSDSIPVLDFPTDRPRPPFRTFNSTREDWVLPNTLVKNLKQYGAKLGCSFMTTLLAGFEVFLHRITGQDDITVGVPAAGQASSGKYNLVGHCVNLLPIRAKIASNQTFSEYLKVRKGAILDAYDHQEFTFGRLIQKLPIHRDPSRIPLVSLMFNIDQDVEGKGFTFDDLEVEVSSNPRSFENFEMFINATVINQKIILECQYNTNLFDAQTIRNRLAEFETLLTGIVDHPDLKISQLPLLTESEKQLLQQWNQVTKGDYPNLCLHQLFEEQVTKTPEKIAVIFADQKLTYQELNEKANQLAIYLQTLGVKPDSKVGICIERSLEMMIGLLGILKSGGCYIPIDPTYPLERLSLMVEDSQLSVLVTQENLKVILPPFKHNVELVSIDQDWSKITEISSTNSLVSNGLTSQNLAYIIYTSGSTGIPKGVQLNHSSVVNFLTSVKNQPGLSTDDTLVAVTTISFDISVLELYLPLTVGASVVIASSEVARDGVQLSQLLSQSQATVVQATPATWQMLLEAEWQGSQNLRVFCGGESLPPALVEQLMDKSSCIWNLYGPTETTVWSTTCQIESANYPISIGRPLLNTQILILDQNLQLVPIGVAGELHIGGDGLARGYLNRPELNSEKFIVNPLSNDPQSRLYKTGDLARWLPNGQIECLGRSDYQVKVRGFRIELGEIDAALSQYSEIKEGVTTVYEDKTGLKSLVAYYIPQKVISGEEQNNFNSQIRQFLSQKLPAYMVSSLFIKLDSLPLTPNGKIDRKALPKPEVFLAELASNLVAPRNENEEKIAQIWVEVLGLEKVGIHNNFFELGGHSLLGTKMIARLSKAFDLNFPLRTLFEIPTIAELAQRVETIRLVAQSAQKITDLPLDEDEEEGEV